jgi:hypothetical protein
MSPSQYRPGDWRSRGTVEDAVELALGMPGPRRDGERSMPGSVVSLT